MMLSQLPPKYTLFVMDGDMVGGLSDVPLTKWTEGKDSDTDLIFYEREWNFGNETLFLRSNIKCDNNIYTLMAVHRNNGW